ncbi:MAG: hypothetical protein K2P93_02980 [Alphaproteobacteria bacterium]|nr:hypothetical protein [Alphaproteobacteria bacterium]
MSTEHTSSEGNTRLKNFRTQDVKKLVQLKGKATEGNLEFILKDPSPSDAHLLAMINDPYLEIKPIGKQMKNGEMYFDLIGLEKQLRIKIIYHKIKD